MPVDTSWRGMYNSHIRHTQRRSQMTQMPRMKGAVTGNFGRAKVKAGQNEPSKYSMGKQSMIIPNRVDAINRYIDAFNNTNDKRLKQSLMEMIRVEQVKRGMIPQNHI